MNFSNGANLVLVKACATICQSGLLHLLSVFLCAATATYHVGLKSIQLSPHHTERREIQCCYVNLAAADHGKELISCIYICICKFDIKYVVVYVNILLNKYYVNFIVVVYIVI